MFSAASTAQWVTAAAAAAVAVVTIVYSSSSLSSVVRSALSRWVYRLQQDEERRLFLLNAPKRIILVRHGQSEGNVSRGRYSEVPDNKIELTPKGHEQAEAAGLYVCSFSFSGLYGLCLAGGSRRSSRQRTSSSTCHRTGDAYRRTRGWPRRLILAARRCTR